MEAVLGIDYALAKELKDAGFPLTLCLDPENCPRDWYVFYFAPYEVPTLEELIEACGEKFITLTRDMTGWLALGDPENGYSHKETHGTTPTEAVARLWIALNKNTDGKTATV